MESTTTWMWLWKVVLVVGIALFAGMAVWVTIGGYQDIKKLFSRLENDQDDSPGDDSREK